MLLDKDKLFDSIKYTPSPAQKMFHNSNKRFRVVAAGARFGKSMAAGAEAVYTFMMPDKRIWIVGTQYELAEREFTWAYQFLSNFTIGNQSILSQCKCTYAQRGAREIKSSWGSFIRTKSTEKPQLLLGEELDLIILAEASQIARIYWERMLRARIGSRKGSVIANSTPNADGGLFNDMFELGQTENEDWESWQFKTIDNPYFSLEEYETAKKSLDESVFQEQYEGKFVSRRGTMFELTENKHSYSKDPVYLESMPILVGVSIKAKNPSLAVFIACDTENKTFYLYDELHKTEVKPNEFIQEIRKKLEGRQVRAVITDYFDLNTKKALEANEIQTTQIDEKKHSKSFSQVRKIQGFKNFLNQDQLKLKIKRSCPEIKESITKSKWGEKKENDLPELETPKSVYLDNSLVLINVCWFLSNIYNLNSFMEL